MGFSMSSPSVFDNGERTTSAQPIVSEDAMPNVIDGTDLFEIIRTTRSMRRLKPDPVPNELI
jgi:hypothetical protein